MDYTEEFYKIILANCLEKKINLYFARKDYNEDYDKYEDNAEYELLNPITIKGYMIEISPEKMYWKKIGKIEGGGADIICKYKDVELFRNARKIVIDNDEYCFYSEGEGSKASFKKLQGGFAKITLIKKDKV